MGLIKILKPWFSSTFRIHMKSNIHTHVHSLIHTCTCDCTLTRAKRMHTQVSLLIIFLLLPSLAAYLSFFLLSRSVKHKHTSGRCSLPMQWKRTETTSGIRVSLITLRHIVLSNFIHCTHLGVNLRFNRSAHLYITVHLPTFHPLPPSQLLLVSCLSIFLLFSSHFSPSLSHARLSISPIFVPSPLSSSKFQSTEGF